MTTESDRDETPVTLPRWALAKLVSAAEGYAEEFGDLPEDCDEIVAGREALGVESEPDDETDETGEAYSAIFEWGQRFGGAGIERAVDAALEHYIRGPMRPTGAPIIGYREPLRFAFDIPLGTWDADAILGTPVTLDDDAKPIGEITEWTGDFVAVKVRATITFHAGVTRETLRGQTLKIPLQPWVPREALTVAFED